MFSTGFFYAVLKSVCIIRYARPQDGGFDFELVKPFSGDVTFAHEEKIVLAIDEQVSESLAKFILDVKFMGEDPELFLTQQNEDESNE